MIIEKSLSEALKDYDKGKHVVVMNKMMDGTFSGVPLESYFPEDTHFLVDVPAYTNPEFEHAIQNMMQHGTMAKEETATETKSEEDDSPPLMML